jgi:hypothetical protein
VLANYFYNYKISADFSNRGRAPDTVARQKMMNNSASSDRMLLEDAIANNECGVINESIIDITYLNDLCVFDGIELPKSRTLSAILLEMNYEHIDKKRIKIKSTNKYHYVWIDSTRINEDEAKEILKDFHESDF